MGSSFFAASARHLPARTIPRSPRASHGAHLFSVRCAAREPLRLPRRVAADQISSVRTGLGAASAGPVHAWALPVPVPVPAAPVQSSLPPGASVIRVPLELLQAMRRTAAVEGHDEGAAWAEAAREWLASRARDDEPQPPTPAAAALPRPRGATTWAAIDAVLADLRTPRRHDGRAA